MVERSLPPPDPIELFARRKVPDDSHRRRQAVERVQEQGSAINPRFPGIPGIATGIWDSFSKYRNSDWDFPTPVQEGPGENALPSLRFLASGRRAFGLQICRGWENAAEKV